MEGKRTKPNQRIRRKNMGYKRILLFLIIIFIIIQLLRIIIPAIYTFSRYTYQSIRSYYLGTKNFYFKSDKLDISATPAHFEAANWSGVDPYQITVKMNSKKNKDVKAEMDISYNIELTYAVYKADGTAYASPANYIRIDLDKPNVVETVSGGEITYTSTGLISVAGGNEDYFSFEIIKLPGVFLANNDYIVVTINATSTSPYVSSLAGDFKVSIGNLGMSYRIEDNEYDPYFKLIVTNSLDSYVVDRAFTYTNTGGQTINCAVGDQINITDYLNCLTDQQREWVHSMYVSLSFDPTVVLLDTASGVYLDAVARNAATNTTDYLTYQNISGNDYVDFVKLKVAAEESKVIRFYKVTAANNYTYQSTDLLNETSIVDVDFE